MGNNNKKGNCINCEEKSCAVKVLDKNQLDLLSNNYTEVLFDKGETLFKQNSLTSHIIFIKNGLIKVHMRGPSKKDQIIKIAKAGCYLGIPSIIGDRINNYSATTLTTVTCCCIDTSTFKELLLLNSKFSYQILEFSCQEGLCNLHKFINQSQKQLPGRMAEALLHFANNIFKSSVFEIPVSRQDLSDLIGTSRESAINTLQELKKDKIIELNGRSIKIIDKDLLEYISEKG